MKSLLIVGAGGYGHLVKEIASLCGYAKIDFVDDNSPEAIGTVSQLETLEEQYDASIVAVGNPIIRQEICKKMKKQITLIHPSAIVSASAVIGVGCVAEAHTVINTAAIIENGSFICAGAVVNHNAIVGNYCQIDCNAVVSSGAKVPDGTKVLSCCVYR